VCWKQTGQEIFDYVTGSYTGDYCLLLHQVIDFLNTIFHTKRLADDAASTLYMRYKYILYKITHDVVEWDVKNLTQLN